MSFVNGRYFDFLALTDLWVISLLVLAGGFLYRKRGKAGHLIS
jgi:hypothetical protein